MSTGGQEAGFWLCGKTAARISAGVIGIWGFVVGCYYDIDVMVASIKMIDESTNKGGFEGRVSFYYSMELMLFTYALTMMVVFSAFLIYGCIFECPNNSPFILTWLIYAVIALVSSMSDSVMFYKYYTLAMILEELAFSGIQALCFFIVYRYLKVYPKRAGKEANARENINSIFRT